MPSVCAPLLWAWLPSFERECIVWAPGSSARTPMAPTHSFTLAPSLTACRLPLRPHRYATYFVGYAEVLQSLDTLEGKVPWALF